MRFSCHFFRTKNFTSKLGSSKCSNLDTARTEEPKARIGAWDWFRSHKSEDHPTKTNKKSMNTCWSLTEHLRTSPNRICFGVFTWAMYGNFLDACAVSPCLKLSQPSLLHCHWAHAAQRFAGHLHRSSSHRQGPACGLGDRPSLSTEQGRSERVKGNLKEC